MLSYKQVCQKGNFPPYFCWLYMDMGIAIMFLFLSKCNLNMILGYSLWLARPEGTHINNQNNLLTEPHTAPASQWQTLSNSLKKRTQYAKRKWIIEMLNTNVSYGDADHIGHLIYHRKNVFNALKSWNKSCSDVTECVAVYHMDLYVK